MVEVSAIAGVYRCERAAEIPVVKRKATSTSKPKAAASKSTRAVKIAVWTIDLYHAPSIQARGAPGEQKRQVDTDFNFHGDDGNENIRCNDLVAELQKTTPRESAFTRYEFQVVIHHAGKEKRFFDALLAAEPRLQVSLAIFCLYLKTKYIHNYTTIKIVVHSYIY